MKMQIFRFSTASVKIHQVLVSFFQQKVSFSSKFESLFSVMRDNSSALLTKVAHQSANFQTCYCSH